MTLLSTAEPMCSAAAYREVATGKLPVMSNSSPPTVRVLLVDDAPVFRQVARELLELRGYVIVGEADSATSAMQAAEELAPDAMLLDVHLPDGNGFDVAAAATARTPRWRYCSYQAMT